VSFDSEVLILPQPFTWKAASLFLLTGAGLYFYFESEKAAQVQRKSQLILCRIINRKSKTGG
jgi:protein SCO1/2